MKEIANQVFESKYQAKIMPGVWFPVRSTVVHLSEGDILVISPGPDTAENLKESCKNLKNIYVVSPNAMHYAHIKSFLAAYPTAQYFGPKEVCKKVPNLADKVKPLEELAKILNNDLEMIPIEGNKFLSETVFFHKETSSLITTDLCFNMQGKMNFLSSCLLKMVGAYARIGQSMLVKLSTQDKGKYLESVSKLKELPIARVIVGHGDIIQQQELDSFWTALSR